MRADFSTKLCILNYYVDGDWGRQREITVFPFKCGMHFDLIVKCDVDVFQVRLNGQYWTLNLEKLKNKWTNTALDLIKKEKNISEYNNVVWNQ